MSIFDPRFRQSHPAGAAAIALYRISQAIGHLLRIRGEETKLSPAQVQALLFLRFARPGVHTIGGLAERLGVSYATASGVADALERKGLIQRQPSPQDARTVTLLLTESGNAQAVELEPVLDDLEEAIAQLPEQEQEALLHATQAIVRKLQDKGHVRVYEMCWNCQFFRYNAHPQDARGPHHCAFVDAPLPEPNTYRECPDFVPLSTLREKREG
jgi:DNA-binding MarR family transcriptional regulator